MRDVGKGRGAGTGDGGMIELNLDVPGHKYRLDQPFRGQVPTLQENIETMWHMAESSIRGLLTVMNQADRAQFRAATIYLAKCWLKDYEELDRRRDRELAAE